jgi:hypothetical protein
MTQNSDRIGKYAATQSFAEIGLGSVFHSLHVPLGGHFLSLNQGLILILACKGPEMTRRRAVSVSVGISSIAALMKALSPAGKRLMPMIAIGSQGLLFSAGPAILGLNLLGCILGMTLLSFWGFIQPLLMAYLLFGQTFFQAVQKLWYGMATAVGIPIEAGVWILVTGVGVKVLLAIAVAITTWKASERFEEKYLRQIETAWNKTARSSLSGHSRLDEKQVGPLLGSLRDLFNPWFLISFTLCVAFVLLTAEPAWEYVLRTIGCSWLFFYCVRAFPRRWIERIIERFPALRSARAQVLKARS